MLYAAFVRSPFGAARIENISAQDALELPGVELVITPSDLDGVPGLRPVLHRDEFVATEMPLLAGKMIRHAGEPVAMVLADSPHAAEDGTEAVAVDYEPLDPVVSLEAALAGDARAVHEGAEGNVLLDVPGPEDPEVDAAFEQAPIVVEATFTTGRVAAVPMEGRACMAEWDGREDRLVLYTSTQVP